MRVKLVGSVILIASLMTLSACDDSPRIAQDPAGSDVDLPADEPVAETLTADPASPGFWAESPSAPDTLIYGYSQSPPLLSLACEQPGELTVTRFATASNNGKILAAWLGNRDAVRFAMDASWNGRGWLWVGTVPANAALSKVVSGDKPMSLTLPGVGRTEMPPSLRVQALVQRCAQDPQVNPA